MLFFMLPLASLFVPPPSGTLGVPCRPGGVVQHGGGHHGGHSDEAGRRLAWRSCPQRPRGQQHPTLPHRTRPGASPGSCAAALPLSLSVVASGHVTPFVLLSAVAWGLTAGGLCAPAPSAAAGVGAPHQVCGRGGGHECAGALLPGPHGLAHPGHGRRALPRRESARDCEWRALASRPLGDVRMA